VESRPAQPPTVTQLIGARLAPLLWGDVKRTSAALALGAATAALGEYVITLAAAPERLGLSTALRLLCLDLVLFAVVYLLLVPVAALAAVVIRLTLVADSRARALAFRGLLAPPAPDQDRTRHAAWMWGGALALVAYMVGSSFLTSFGSTLFKETQLLAALLAACQVGLFALCAALAWTTSALVARLARRVAGPGRRARLNPLAHPTAAAIGLLGLGAPLVGLALALLPQLRPLVPWRHLVSAGLFALGARAAIDLIGRRGSLLPRSPRARLAAFGILLFAGALVMPVTLIALGADPATKGVAVGASPPLRGVVDLLRRATDFDGDGYGTLLGENDCAPFEAAQHPLARDLPDNGIDENCDGRDFQLGRMPTYRKGQRMPVPDGFRRPWNVLLITVDTVRYDHTTMGGYAERTGRNTTPELAELAGRSISFTFANAPSAGTMASIPAILTSKFFHSGIALDESVKRGKPPRIKDENLLLAEMFQAAGFMTGAILSHEWFGDWGLQQGFASYDNLVPKSDPYGSSADRVTDAAVAWIGQRGDNPWFLWLHYIDPHGRYVAHPGEPSFGAREEDLYDGELAYTDKQLGRLFDEIGRMPAAERTIVALTSDHGDGFNEHGFVNHGQALYRELLHVPLIIYVPNAEPRRVGGAVSPLDIAPTLVDLCRLDARGVELEGESLVPQLFYGQDASDRVVFAETNAGRTLRAATTGRYKLIQDLRANVYELYDLAKDPWEKRNLWPNGDRAGFEEMRRYLDDWLERVYYARDPVANQAMTKIADVLLAAPPQPKVPVAGASLDDGAIRVIGFEGDKPSYAPGDRAEIAVYFQAVRRPSGHFLFQLEAWRKEADPPRDKDAPAPRGKDAAPRGPSAAKSGFKATAGGLLPTSRWRDGEYIRDRIKLRIPEAWAASSGGSVVLGLRTETATGRKPVPPRGNSPSGDPGLLILGELRLDLPPPGKPAPTAPKKK